MRVIILAKAPVAGKVKTRLMPQYTAQQAANLHKSMAETVLNKVCSVFDDVWLAVDDIDHEFFKKAVCRHKVILVSQSQGNLGKRLRELTKQSFDIDASAVMFLGTDSPHVSVQRLIDAHTKIQTSDVVIGPVEDGGYDFIALKRMYIQLFDDIHWGTESTYEETMNHITKMKLSVDTLDMSYDLDRAEDLQRAPPHTWL